MGDWNIRGAILFSLSLQIFLVICSPLRKRVQKGLLLFSIWLAYLIADWAANYSVGLIASNQDPNSKTIISTHSDLLAFWAPFLLVHLGGPDTITAFSLEDNQLWLRHLLGSIIQFISCAYVFLLTVPGNRLWIPTVLVFVAGVIKYGERTYALYLASNYPRLTAGYLPVVEVKVSDIDEILSQVRAAKVSDIDEIPKDGGDVEMLSQVGVVLLASRFLFPKSKNPSELILGVQMDLQFLRPIFVLNHYRFSGIFMWLHVVKNPFLLELWEFIFNELKRKSAEAVDDETANRICNSRGGWILKSSLIGEEERRENMMPYVDGNQFDFDESLVLWHIATHLCYVEDGDCQVDEREFSKLLSDYMMSLQIGQKKFQETLVLLMPSFDNDEDEGEACKIFLDKFKDTSISTFGIQTRPLFSHACILAKELGVISQVGIKWKIISQVWVEWLSFAACNCRKFIHFQHLSKGRELISLVWLLMIRLALLRAGADLHY